MTLIELQEILGERIKVTNDLGLDDNQIKRENEKSDMIARLAKQMINNADVVLRTDKLISEGKLEQSSIKKIIGGKNE